jgi:hypothetical protein
MRKRSRATKTMLSRTTGPTRCRVDVSLPFVQNTTKYRKMPACRHRIGERERVRERVRESE